MSEYVKILTATENNYDTKTLERSDSPVRDEKHIYGPMWGGKLFDKDIINKMSPEGMADERRCARVLEIWKEEVDSNPYQYDMSEVASHLKVSTPRYDTFMSELSKFGETSRTHMSPTAFKTEVPLEKILEVFSSVSDKN